MNKPNYLDDLTAIGQAAPAGTVQMVDIYHDDGCALLERRGPCDCTPELVVRGGGQA